MTTYLTKDQIKELEKSPLFEKLPERTPYERGVLDRYQDKSRRTKKSRTKKKRR